MQETCEGVPLSFLLCKSTADYSMRHFPAPVGTTENNARKLHALYVCHILWCVLAHEVLYEYLAIHLRYPGPENRPRLHIVSKNFA